MSAVLAVIAHRGFSSKAPENTTAAFDMAINAGYRNIEMDVRLTADEVPVIFHDSDLDRTSDGHGELARLRFEDVQKLDAGSWFSEQFQGEKIPALEQIFRRYTSEAHLHVELRSEQSKLAEKVVEAFEVSGFLESDSPDAPFDVPGITITSFHLEQLQRSKGVMPSTIRHGWLVQSITKEIIATALNHGINGVYPRACYARRKGVQQAIQNGLTVRGWGVKTEKDLLQLVEAGAQGATVDWPDAARRILRSDHK